MVYLSVTEKGKELLHESRPTRRSRHSEIYIDNYWYNYYNPLDAIASPNVIPSVKFIFLYDELLPAGL